MKKLLQHITGPMDVDHKFLPLFQKGGKKSPINNRAFEQTRMYGDFLTNNKLRSPEAVVKEIEDKERIRKQILATPPRREEGTIRAAGPRQSTASKAWEVLTNPVEAFGYAVRGQRLPDNFSKGESRTSGLNTVTNMINPFAWVNSGINAGKSAGETVNNLADGEFEQAATSFLNTGLNTLGALPLLSAESKAAQQALGRFVTTRTPVRNAYKINPVAGKLNRFNRVVGEDAVDDIRFNEVVRSGEGVKVKIPWGSNRIKTVNRQTPFASFSEGMPQQRYIDQVLAEGKQPFIISTNRPMGVSTLGRHGKGSTMFPVDQSGKYVRSFPASEADVFPSTPHWLKGYQKIKFGPYSSKREIMGLNDPAILAGQLGESLSGNAGAFNTGVFTLKNNPNVLVKFENPKKVGDFMGFDDYVNYNFADAMKNISNPNVGSVFHQLNIGPGQRAMFLRKLPGQSFGSIPTKISRKIDPAAISRFYDDLKEVRNQNMGFDFVGDNYMFDPKSGAFKLFDINPTFQRSTSSAENWMSHVLKNTDIPGHTFPGHDPYVITGKNLKQAVTEKLLRDFQRGLGQDIQQMYTRYGNTPVSPDRISLFQQRSLDNFYSKLKDALSKYDESNPSSFYKQGGLIEDNGGQWNHPGDITRIRSKNITMQGVPYPVYAIPNKGKGGIMYPGENYVFPEADYVDEYPMMQYGGNNYNDTPKAQKGKTIYVSNLKDPALIRYNDSLALYNNYIKTKAGFDKALVDLDNNPKKIGVTKVSARPLSNPFQLPDEASTIFMTNTHPKETAPQYDTRIEGNKVKRIQTGNVTFPAFDDMQSSLISPVNILEYNPDYDHYAQNPNYTGDVKQVRKATSGDFYWMKNPKEKAEMLKKWPHVLEHSKRNIGRFLFEYVKPVQPVVYKPDFSYQLLQPKQPTTLKSFEYNPDTPTKYSFTYPTGKYNEQKTMYFPTKSALKAFTQGVRGATYQEGDSWASATGNYKDGGGYGVFGYVGDGWYKNGGQHGGLDRWFAEKWVDVKTGKTCGRQEGESRAYPACRPSRRVSSETPKTSSEMSPSEKAKFKRTKTSSERIPYNHKKAQWGQQVSSQDSVRNIAGNILKYEQLRGGPGGTPLPQYSDPKYMQMLMQNIYPEIKKILPNASAMEAGEAMDFVFNAGWDQSANKITKDPRAYALQEYYRQYDPSKLDAEGKWSGRKNPAYSFDQEYANTIDKLSENQRRILMNRGRDWYYRNINNPLPGVPNNNYYDTWFGRIWNTNEYAPFNANNPKFIYKKK